MINSYKVVLFIFSLFVLIVGKVFAQVSPVEFRFVCEKAGSGCTQEFEEVSGEELWVENKPVLDVEDIEFAAIESRSETVDGINVGVRFYDISIKFKNVDELEEVTSMNVDKRLGVFIDQKLIIAPIIREGISGGEITITVDRFEEVLAKRMVDFINNAVRMKGAIPKRISS